MGGGRGVRGEVYMDVHECISRCFLCCLLYGRFETAPPHSELLPPAPPDVATVRVERLRRKLKAQVQQTNYLRTRLGEG